jgi:ribonucleoside-diphosphate reductase alpha chain
LAAIGEVIEQHMIDTGFITKEDGHPISEAVRAVVGDLDPPQEAARLKGCPRCGERAMIRQEGCETCTSCGFSKCS